MKEDKEKKNFLQNIGKFLGDKSEKIKNLFRKPVSHYSDLSQPFVSFQKETMNKGGSSLSQGFPSQKEKINKKLTLGEKFSNFFSRVTNFFPFRKKNILDEVYSSNQKDPQKPLLNSSADDIMKGLGVKITHTLPVSDDDSMFYINFEREISADSNYLEETKPNFSKEDKENSSLKPYRKEWEKAWEKAVIVRREFVEEKKAFLEGVPPFDGSVSKRAVMNFDMSSKFLNQIKKELNDAKKNYEQAKLNLQGPSKAQEESHDDDNQRCRLN